MILKPIEELKDYHVKRITPKRVLVEIDVDDYTSSDQAFDFACTISLPAQAQLGIVTVVESRDINVFDSLSPGKMDEKRLEASHDLMTYVKKAQEFGLVDTKPILTEGTPDKAILDEVVPQFKPDLIVVGSETKKISGKTIGSQAEGIIERSPVSVIVVR